MKVRFLRNYKVAAVDGDEHCEGDECDLPEASAKHFINRGIAEECDGDDCPPKPKPKPTGRRARAKDAEE